MIFLFLFILSSSSLFSANIAICCKELYPYSTCVLEADEIIKRLIAKGHFAQMEHNKETFSQYDILVSTCIKIPDDCKHKTILFVCEPKVVLPNMYKEKNLENFLKVYSFDHDRANIDPKYGKMFYTRIYREFDHIDIPFVSFHDRKFSCLINSILPNYFKKPGQLYLKRLAVAKYYNKRHPYMFSAFGARGWSKKHLFVYKGKCKSKNHTLANHRFCYCFENWDNNMHYISEKILDCFHAGCVPIYLGSSRITDYIPEETFIDARKFNSIREIHQHIVSMNEKTWLGYIHAMQEFVQSDAYYSFSREGHINRVIDAIEKALN